VILMSTYSVLSYLCKTGKKTAETSAIRVS
jgi:hypothetical protein